MVHTWLPKEKQLKPKYGYKDNWHDLRKGQPGMGRTY